MSVHCDTLTVRARARLGGKSEARRPSFARFGGEDVKFFHLSHSNRNTVGISHWDFFVVMFSQ